MGVLEAPLLNLPVVNVGLRQKDRQNAGNIIFVPHSSHAIIKAVNKSLFDKSYINKIQNKTNPYKKKGASKKIVKILIKLLNKQNILDKKITY